VADLAIGGGSVWPAGAKSAKWVSTLAAFWQIKGINNQHILGVIFGKNKGGIIFLSIFFRANQYDILYYNNFF